MLTTRPVPFAWFAMMLVAITPALTASCTKRSSAPQGGAHMDAAAASADARPADAASPGARGDTPAGSRAWLDVKLPPAPPAGATSAKAVLALREDKSVTSEYAGLRIWAGSSTPRLVPAGTSVELAVPAGGNAPLRIEVGGFRVLAHVRPGDLLAVREGHDGGWTAMIGNRMAENAPRSLTICISMQDGCPAEYTRTYVYAGDPVCPVPADESYGHKCVKAPKVRGRGSLAGRAEVVDDVDAKPLTRQPLAANTVGPWVVVQTAAESMPRVRLGDAEAFLIMSPGDACEVWLDDQGRVDSALVATK
jgi:hypothetical protein